MPRPRARRTLARLAAPALALALAAGATGCGSAEDVSRDTFVEDLLDRTRSSDGPGLSQEQAECLVDRIFEEFTTPAERNRIYRAATVGELGQETQDRLAALNAECVDGGAPGDPPAGDTDSTTTTGTSAPG